MRMNFVERDNGFSMGETPPPRSPEPPWRGKGFCKPTVKVMAVWQMPVHKSLEPYKSGEPNPLFEMPYKNGYVAFDIEKCEPYDRRCYESGGECFPIQKYPKGPYPKNVWSLSYRYKLPAGHPFKDWGNTHVTDEGGRGLGPGGYGTGLGVGKDYKYRNNVVSKYVLFSKAREDAFSTVKGAQEFFDNYKERSLELGMEMARDVEYLYADGMQPWAGDPTTQLPEIFFTHANPCRCVKL